LESLLEPVSLDKGATLFDIGDVVRYGYFPTGGLVSLVVLTAEGGSVEVATVAREGVVGLPVLLHATTAPHQAIVRLPGDALRFKAHVLRAEINRQGILRSALLEYANRASADVAQAVVCQCFHNVMQRLCRWLLAASDRTGSATLELTQESLAHALGVARPVVTKAALELQNANCIRYRYGRLTIIDRSTLERSACECYRPPTLSDLHSTTS
jgi:CRP-like cAMP-binding protein